MKGEALLQLQVSTYLKVQYPDVLFMTDFAAGLKLTIGQAVKRKKLNSCSGFPDLFIFAKKRGYIGMAIELKAEGIKLKKKDNNTWINKHVQRQASVLRRLREEGWYSLFCIGLDQTINEIDSYLKE